MALSTYDDLKAAVADWLKKTDIGARIPDFINLAEITLNRGKRIPSMFQLFTGDVSPSVKTVLLPARTRQVIYARANDSAHTILLYRSVAQLELDFPSHLSRSPMAYTLIGTPLSEFSEEFTEEFTGENEVLTMLVGPSPDGDYTIDGIVRRSFQLLSDENPSNYWLVHASDLLLYGALLAATPYLKDDARLATWASLYKEQEVAFDNSIKLLDNPENLAGALPATTMVV